MQLLYYTFMYIVTRSSLENRSGLAIGKHSAACDTILTISLTRNEK